MTVQSLKLRELQPMPGLRVVLKPKSKHASNTKRKKTLKCDPTPLVVVNSLKRPGTEERK
jgi:hypothetical protein